MTDQIFIDTDCFSSFLWVGKENLLVQIYKNQLIVPTQVYNEIRKVPPLKRRTDSLLANGDIVLGSIVLGTPEADLYMKLTSRPDPGYKIIGAGEASSISLALHNNGILGSNNMRDIRPYIDLYKLKHITTGDIMINALTKGLISEGQGNTIWTDMISRQRMLPTLSFSDYLASKKIS